MGRAEHSTALAATAARAVLVAAALSVLACLAGCRGDEPGEPPRLEAVDVAPAIDVDPADDQQAVKRGPELVGLLPPDFPPDLPLYLPASLVDFGRVEDGRRYVSLLSPDPPSRVGRELESKVRAGGWSITGAGGAKVLTKAGRRVRLHVEEGRPGTLYRFEYSR